MPKRTSKARHPKTAPKPKTKVTYKVQDVHKASDLPELYMVFPDDVERAVARLSQIEAKLRVRGREPIRPLQIFRMHYDVYIEPYTLLMIALREVSL